MKVAINGFGRIGRTCLRQIYQYNFKKDIEVVAINDLGDIENMAYLLKYDSVYRIFDREVSVIKEGNKSFLKVGDDKIIYLSEPNPENLPWKDLKIDCVIEATGFFTDKEGAEKHIKAGAKRVVITAPAKGDVPHLLPGSTENIEVATLEKVTSNASCTTNAVAPVVAIMMENPGIEKAFLTTVHAYTATQKIVDGPSSKDFRRGRAGAQNIVLTSTGAAKATGKVLPGVSEIFDGIAIRVPVITGSLVDFTFLAKRNTTADEINDIFRSAAKQKRWEGILKVVEDPIVSSDIIGDPYPSIVDLTFTRVVGGNLVKVFAWYDNEWGYVNSLLRHIVTFCK
ncbi:Glyceraldehyde-3-phosphate dehydrogenase [bacterium HR34]|nr:Glyceraldehyde-3-phosphate dehydrogenase [bacterium HR34]